MMEEPLSQGASPSGDSNFSGSGELNSTIVALDERILDITSRHSLSVRTPPTKKAKRIRFFRNGDKFYTGVVMAVTPERYRNFDSLASDLTRALISSVTLPNGVRAIYTMDGRKVQNISDLEDGKCYVVSGQGEIFKKVEYSSSKVRRGSSLSGLPQSPAGTGRQISAIPLCVKARIVTLIRHGTKPRKVVRLLLNKRNAPSLEHAMEAITEAVKLDSGAVRKVYTLSGHQVTALEQFFDNEEIFVAYGQEKSNQEDFELDFEESKSVQSFRRCVWISKRQNGPMPRMPRKSGKKALTTPQVRTPSPSSLMLPQPLRLHYAVGHVIGDGNFAVVRQCIHKSTGAEYAMKIVDKYKCQGKETMLASEVAILRQVCHPNIISLIAEQETTDQLFLVMEFVKGGDLFDAIAAATKFSEAEASVMIGHLTSALAYLHSHHIVHRDVKPENLLVELDSSHVRCLKLGDFGLAQVVREPLYTVCGTPTYVAPEILAETGYGLKIDVWAAGVILYILLCGFPPFVSPENEQEELFERILSGQYEFTSPYWDTVSDSAKQLITNMLQAQPELRFSAEDVLDHPWLASFLGGEQTTTATTPTNTTEQHWDQQRKPIRLATFEFDFKKQRRGGDPSQKIDSVAAKEKNKWSNALSVLDANDSCSGVSKVQECAASHDEVDFINGNHSQDEPVSLSADCLQDINTLSESMHNLINNLNENQSQRNCLELSRTETTSMNSIPGNVKLSTQKSDIAFNASKPRENVSDCISIFHNNIRVRTNLAAVQLSQEISDISATSDVPNCNYIVTPNLDTTYVNSDTLETQQSYEIYVSNCTKNDDIKNCNMVSSSTDSLTGSSSNDIETSDSFVNIQFAQLARGQKSSSTQSMESTDSFENISLCNNKWIKNDVDVTNKNGHNDEIVQSIDYTKKVVSKMPEKSVPKILQPQVNSGDNTSRLHKSIGGNRRRSTHYTYKVQDTAGSTKNEAVKLRDEKHHFTGSQVDPTNVDKNKRFSCLAKKALESPNKPTCGSTRSPRKFSSTDELRDDKQKVNTRTKRFSLYYTPQPLRKTYEPEVMPGKKVSKGVTVTHNERQNIAKTADMYKKREEISGCDERKSSRHHKSLVDGSTAASRSKSSRQSVHIRSNVVNPNLTPGRIK